MAKKKEQAQTEQVQETAEVNEAAAIETEQTAEIPENVTLTRDEFIEVKNRIDTLQKDKDETIAMAQRLQADFDNYRKRMLKEKQDTFDYANANLLGDLLESLDNFDRTVEASNNATDAKSIADGIKMINKNLVKMLEDKYNLVSYGKPGDAFNPDEHEALRSEEGKVKEPEIKEVYLKGYKLKEKIIRHAKVLVTMPVSE